MRRIAVAVLTMLMMASCGSDAERTPGDAVVVSGTDVFAVERSPDTDQDAPTLLFLHGASFTAEVWIETGILQAAADAGIRSVAVDLPGFGETASIDTDRGDFLSALLSEVDNGNGVVVVSPSMSGGWSLDLLASDAGASMRGFVPVAPVGISDFATAIDQPIDDVTTLIVWGADDDVISIDLADDLSDAIVGSEDVVIRDAGHAAYQDQPDEFVALLVDFAREL